jgi:hypothetical protein
LADARFQYIPIPSWEIVAALTETSPEFTEVSRLLTAIYQLELHAELEQLERAYAPFNPDLDERAPSRASEPSPNAAKEFSERLSKILERGNYERLTEADINHAFETRSLFPINVVVDTSVYADFVIFARGETNRSASIPRLYGLARKTIPVPTFDRVCIYIRFKTAAELQLEPSELDKQPFEPGTSVLKLFRNIPKADLEMVFPNCRPTMRPIDKLLFGVPALVGGIPVILKLIPAAVALAIVFGLSGGELDIKSLITGLGGLAVLGSYLWRQWDKFKNRRILFGKVLTENLYFRNLDTNEGVLTRVIDEADDEEFKEALLGYVFAQRADGWATEEQLDSKVEAFLRERFGCDIDFEMNDALAKVEALGLIERDGEKLRGRPIDEAVTRLRAKLAEITG